MITAVAEYRAACDAVQPAWEKLIHDTRADSPGRYKAVGEYRQIQEHIRHTRAALLELALDGRWETPR